MKIFGKFEFLDETSTVLQLDPALAHAMSITNGTLLYTVALVHDRLARSRGRKMMLIGTTFPEQSWCRLIRVALCLDTLRGGLFKTLAALNALQLHCRYLEEVAGARLATSELRVAGRPVTLPGTKAGDDILLPSVLLVLELPNHGSTPLHLELAKLFDEESRDQSRARELLTQELRARINELTSQAEGGSAENQTRVHWLAPMTTLYRLCDPENPKADRVRVTNTGSKARRRKRCPSSSRWPSASCTRP